METAEIMFSGINYHGNSKQSYNEVSPYPYRMGTVKRQYIYQMLVKIVKNRYFL